MSIVITHLTHIHTELSHKQIRKSGNSYHTPHTHTGLSHKQIRKSGNSYHTPHTHTHTHTH